MSEYWSRISPKRKQTYVIEHRWKEDMALTSTTTTKAESADGALAQLRKLLPEHEHRVVEIRKDWRP